MNNKKRDCFATLAMTWRGKRSFAFTLSEVLIVLAVLGVIAAMTIPDLIQDYREKALITALKKNYSIFSQAVDMAIAENGSPENWDIGVRASQAGALKLYNILKSYLRIEKYCGYSAGCFANHYEALFNENYGHQPDTIVVYVKGVLASGASFAIYSQGTGCPNANESCGNIVVDVNGKLGPNKAGVDLFSFFIHTNGLMLSGEASQNLGNCQYNNNNGYNGGECAYWAFKHENMDYLRKAGKYVGY